MAAAEDNPASRDVRPFIRREDSRHWPVKPETETGLVVLLCKPGISKS